MFGMSTKVKLKLPHLIGVTALLVLLATVACATSTPTVTPQIRVETVAPPATNAPAESAPTESEPASEPGGGGGGLEEPEQEWVVRTDSDEVDLILATPDLGVGIRRFGMVLTDSSGIVAFPVVQIQSFFYFDEEATKADRDGPVETALARYYPFPYGTRGIHVAELNFDEPGLWGVEASVPRPDGEIEVVEVLVEIHERPKSVDVGERPPDKDSRTLADVEDISQLTTGSMHDESLYQISIADAIDSGRPTVVVFASPAFCTNAVCGPQVEVLSNLSSTYGDRAHFVHIDLFVNPKEIQGDLTRARPTPLLSDWGLVSQEWTFVMDNEGVVVGRFENFVPEEELELSLMSVLESG